MADKTRPPRQGASTGPDPRVTPMRRRPGAVGFELVRALDGRPYEVAEPTAPVRRAPFPDAPLDTEALKGERVTVYETTEEGWAWGQLAADSYVRSEERRVGKACKRRR